jgi:hypothetical protein
VAPAMSSPSSRIHNIILAGTISWKWSRFWNRALGGPIFGLIGALIVALIVALIGGLIGTLIVGQSPQLNGVLVLIVKIFSVLFGGSVLFGLVNGLAGGFTSEIKVDKESPNQGVKLSLKNSLIAFIITFLTVGMIDG